MADILTTTAFAPLAAAGHPVVTAPTAAAGSSAGGSPPAPVITPGSSDLRGNLTFGTGTTPAAGAQVVVTFGTPFSSPLGQNALANPIVMLTPGNAATAVLDLCAITVTQTGFTISCNTAPTASQGNTTYSVNWAVLE